jgi:hypothetical protein
VSPDEELEEIRQRARKRQLARAARITPAIATTLALVVVEWCTIGPDLCCGATLAVLAGVVVGVVTDRLLPPVPDP